MYITLHLKTLTSMICLQLPRQWGANIRYTYMCNIFFAFDIHTCTFFLFLHSIYIHVRFFFWHSIYIHVIFFLHSIYIHTCTIFTNIHVYIRVYACIYVHLRHIYDITHENFDLGWFTFFFLQLSRQWSASWCIPYM